ncbi:asparagine synthetase B family protein [Planomonospora sp. ID67723]|uniref:asparagine synthetase B family protein n=1 Tax=Planomonospora sp. ID67723 TaxID=2738134 RepID=UPI0018C37043|nr:asparagine synthetase B family protein [Planomonospora sp. ID67723]MBG0828292.1 asparagine synthetase B family protein [Planomonospora sp. ID67723]
MQWPTFNVRPYVCGGLGHLDEAALAALQAAGPRVRPALRTREAALFSSAPLPPYRRSPERGGAGQGHADSRDAEPRDAGTWAFAWGERRPAGKDVQGSWIAVAETYETPGLIDDGDRVTLHAGGLGLVDVYYLVSGGAVYFSSLLEPLLSLARTPYEIDWEAWASIVQLTFPLRDDTPYAQVKRLAGASALVFDKGRGALSTDRRLPRWLREEPYEAGRSAGEILEILHEVYKEFDGRPLLVPVSGGYDSRLLCSVAVARGADVESWTTSPDDGTDTDIAFAKAITRELGVRHRVIGQDPAAYPDDALAVARRLEFLTPHHAWYAPFAREVHRAGRTLVDGLAGGPLLKNFMVSGAALTASTQAERKAALLGSLALGAPSVPFLSEPAAEWITSTVGAAFAQATSMLNGHRAELPLSVLHTRTARGIARSAVNLVGPEVSFVAPFMHPDFFDAALSVGVARKDGGRFYREVLHAANPRVAALPSTNVVKQPLQRVPLRSAAAPARVYGHEMLTRVARAVPSMLSEPLHAVVAEGPDALARFNGWNDRFWVRSLVLFGAWLGDYADRLPDPTPPWD